MLEMTGLSLLYVGVVLFINGLWLLEKIPAQEIIFIDTFVGILTFLIAAFLVFSSETMPQAIEAGGLTFLFSCTYLWVAFNQYHKHDGRGLGWYCLFVAITAIPVAINILLHTYSVWDQWFGLCWVSWAILWFVYFLHLVYKKILPKVVGWLTIIIGITSAWLPGYLLLSHHFI